ncbi:hypothetical protein B5V88_06180 [Heyndrickxia sporothermodurans]|uniref:Uncharacterized protein n=2 Tax=Heyndrickxia TaxID=2837504 RepID=A0A150LG97_9BACI|nr:MULTISPECIES: hypothetical protein [Heyndrickxia]KYD11265.1 hypothetical protein B4102_2230 [Heyndrickxia sporothermodurans]MBL5791998.1 hypothetical protein [Heyndrickxia sporothermodurans]MBL5803143.1 hypothetical protein [Heyndrickxia sporothermodurans]MBL5807922.1 hypothetical protein [Heyndrickxia sporothermodurans]MBL5853117.1 hypothetical protein [Heyndrickxia sporothermodurans]
MSKEHIKGLSIISSLLMIMGLFLMFFSVSIGTYLGDSWVSNQPGVYDNDDSLYTLIIETYINNLVIVGSILFSVGLLAGVFTYIKSFLSGTKGTTMSSNNND